MPAYPHAGFMLSYPWVFVFLLSLKHLFVLPWACSSEACEYFKHSPCSHLGVLAVATDTIWSLGALLILVLSIRIPIS